MAERTIGVESRTVRLQEPSSEWQSMFASEQRILGAELGNHVLDIQHVGSTALGRIVAKPIIDIGIAVSRYEDARICIDPMKKLGYEYRGEAGISRRHYFVKGQPRTHHVHMVETDSDAWISLVAFRDYLMTHLLVEARYENLKKELALRYANEREKYQSAKEPFVKAIIAMAIADRGK